MSITYEQEGTNLTGQTTEPLALAYPVTGLSSGDLFVIQLACKYGCTVSASGFTHQGSISVWTGTGVDAGVVEVHILTKEAAGSESGTENVTVTGINVAAAVMSRLRKTGGTWNFQFRSGIDDDLGTSVTCTGASATWANGDYVMMTAGCNGNLVPFSAAASLSASGISLGTQNNIATSSTSGGSDMAWSFVGVPVTSAGTAAPVMSATMTGTPTSDTPAVATAFLIISESAAGGDVSISAGLGALTLTGLAPSLDLGITSGLGQLVITGLAPTLTATENVSVASGLGQLTITGLAPTVSVSDNLSITTGLGQLTLSGLAPQIGDSPNISTGLGALVINGLAPTLSTTEHQSITTGLGELQITGLAPEVREQLYINLGLGELLISGFAPTVEEGTGATITTGLGELVINGYAPTIDGADEERRTVGVPGRSYQFLIYINGKPHYGDQDEIREMIEELAEKDAEQPKKPRTRIVVQQGKPILKSEPKPTKAELMQVQTNLRDYYLEVYAKIKLKEMEDDEDFLLLL